MLDDGSCENDRAFGQQRQLTQSLSHTRIKVCGFLVFMIRVQG